MLTKARRTFTRYQWCVALGLAAVGPVVLAEAMRAGAPAAQGQILAGEGSMTVDRSRAIQAELQRIDADRAGWVSEFLGAWDRVLDPRVYDVRSELARMAMSAPAWQLYGASLVGDFDTMVRVLRGKTGAGAYINAIASPQRKLAPPRMESSDARPFALGSSSNSLVYTPIAPCRMVDTRPGPDGPGARTGVMPINSTRTFDLTTRGQTEGQGGGFFPCPGLPSVSPAAWVVNITVPGAYSGFGGLKAWGFSSGEPNASVINWQAGQVGAIANAVTLVGCAGCNDDITIRTFGDATHVIIDVMGYFDSATAAGSAVTRIAGPLANLAPGFKQQVEGGACPAGTIVIAGELDHGGTNVSISETFFAADKWFFAVNNNDAALVTVRPFSRCLDTPIVLF
jgi:hypothetical protein